MSAVPAKERKHPKIKTRGKARGKHPQRACPRATPKAISRIRTLFYPPIQLYQYSIPIFVMVVKFDLGALAVSGGSTAVFGAGVY
jgi:hypothetical protein